MEDSNKQHLTKKKKQKENSQEKLQNLKNNKKPKEKTFLFFLINAGC